MVNVYITGDKDKFLSKNAIGRLKKKIKQVDDLLLISNNEFLKEGYSLNLKKESDGVHVEIKEEEHLWGNMGAETTEQIEKREAISEANKKEENKKRLREKLRAARARRSGQNYREMKTIQKNVPKTIFEKYNWIKNTNSEFPITKPNELLDEPEKHKQQIEFFASGFIKISGNNKFDNIVVNYYREISDKVGYPILSEEQVKEKLSALQPKPVEPEVNKLPENINLSKYIDSDTESDSSDSEEDK